MFQFQGAEQEPQYPRVHGAKRTARRIRTDVTYNFVADGQLRSELDRRIDAGAGRSQFTVADLHLGRVLELRAKFVNRNASLILYEEPAGDVVAPFLIGEIAGSLSIQNVRLRLREFAEAILDSLEDTENAPNNVVQDAAFGRCNHS